MFVSLAVSSRKMDEIISLSPSNNVGGGRQVVNYPGSLKWVKQNVWADIKL